MAKVLTWGLLLPVILGLVACAQTGRENREKEQVTLFKKGDESVVIHSTFGSSDIRNWRAVDNSTLIIETYSKGKLVATLMSSCPGIRFAETIGLSTLGPFALDKYTTVILPDGTRCHFKELNPYIELDKSE